MSDPGVLDRFLDVVVDPGRGAPLHELAGPRGDLDEERERAVELLTRVRDWTAAGLARAGTARPLLPAGRLDTGEDASRLLQVLEPVDEELEAAPPPVRRLVSAATAAARAGTCLGPETPPRGDDLLEVSRRAGEALGAWGAIGVGDPVAEAERTIRAATGHRGISR